MHAEQLTIEFTKPAPRQPRYPKSSQTQLWALLTALQAGKSFTFLDSVHELGIAALSQRVGDLRKLGWPIRDKWEETKNGATIKRYSL